MDMKLTPLNLLAHRRLTRLQKNGQLSRTRARTSRREAVKRRRLGHGSRTNHSARSARQPPPTPSKSSLEEGWINGDIFLDVMVWAMSDTRFMC